MSASRLRVAWWGPLPPQESGISDYSFDMLGELSEELDLHAVVRDDEVDRARVPEGVGLIGATKYRAGLAGGFDLDVYQMGNHPWFHGYMHEAVLETPGLLVLHDAALLDFYAVICGGLDSPVLFEEARLEHPSLLARLPSLVRGGKREPDRLAAPLSRRLVDASLMTIVHSKPLRDELAARYPGALVSHVNQPARLLKSTPQRPRPEDEVVFGIFGSLERHKRVPVAVAAFARVHARYPERARLVIAGRLDNPGVEREVRKIVRNSHIGDAVRIRTNLRLSELEDEILASDVVVCLRWPTAGEVSASLMRALGAGKPVIASDVLQYRDLDPKFCWRVSTDPASEQKEIEEHMVRAMERPELVHSGGAAARRFVAAEATPAASAQAYLEAIRRCSQMRAAKAPHAVRGRLLRTDVPAVNVIADWQATTGLAEAARRSAGALVEAGIDVAAEEVTEAYAPRDRTRLPEWLDEVPKGRLHEIDICYLNVNELSILSDEELRPRGADGYLIGHWFWELPALARAFRHEIDRVDEIWVGSRFTKEAFIGHTDKPVRIIPCVVTAPSSPPLSRQQLGLPEDACLFLFHFDAFSTLARKNPWAVISAFRRAFTEKERTEQVRLVLKTINLSRCPPAAGERVVREMAQVNGILLDTELSTAEMASLIARCDVYVSLHRSEGFGLGMAEAMLAGRPTIATSYSGNLDFMTHANSCLVGYRLMPVTTSEFQFNPGMEVVYEADQLWAEADVDQAARFMRVLYENPALRERLGAAGAATVRSRYNSAAAGAAAAARLKEIAAMRKRKKRRTSVSR